MSDDKTKVVNSRPIPGRQTIFYVSAEKGGFADLVLTEFAKSHPDWEKPMGLQRKFENWKSSANGTHSASGVIVDANGVTRPIVLVRGRYHEGLFLQDVRGKQCSMRYNLEAKNPVIMVGGDHESERRGIRAAGLARQLAALIHRGIGWEDRNGTEHPTPWGSVIDPMSRHGKKHERQRARQRLHLESISAHASLAASLAQ